MNFFHGIGRTSKNLNEKQPDSGRRRSLSAGYWRCADQAQINDASCELFGCYCISWSGSDRSIALTVRRPPHTPDVPLAVVPISRSGRNSHRNPIITAPAVHSNRTHSAILAGYREFRGRRGYMNRQELCGGETHRIGLRQTKEG